jgi:hypothetical protein
VTVPDGPPALLISGRQPRSTVRVLRLEITGTRAALRVHDELDALLDRLDPA